MSKTIYVYENFFSEIPNFLGTLYMDSVRGNEHCSFEYDESWLRTSHLNFLLDPDLSFYNGRQYPAAQPNFGFFADSAPDRWGRILMDRRERLTAKGEGRKPRKLLESDYLIGVYDEVRMGALRFKQDKDGPFLSDDQGTAVPPWTTLRTLEEASRNFESEETTLEEKWLSQLIKPGSSLGGARPKATVLAPDGSMWIAKFPSHNDSHNVGAWEMVAHDLAKLCGLNVPEAKLESFSKYGSTFLVKRFDREGSKRLHFASAMTLLGKTDGASSSDGSSYLDLASFIKSNGASPEKDLLELWKRIVFNMAITNTDDHLRNHGFILTKTGWRLSPLYDVNPVPYGNELSLNVDDTSNEISLELAVSAAKYFGIDKATAEKISSEIVSIVKSRWEQLASGVGISRNGIELMRPAFME